MNNKNYRVLKILNNNIILAYDLENRQDTILVGRGLGFNKKENKKEYIPKENIQKSFIAYDEKMKKEYFNLVKQIDPKIIVVCETIIQISEKKLGDLNNHIHMLLADHISFAIERVKTGLKITNPFINEIQILYPDEFNIAVKGVKLIQENLGIDLGFGEMGFIAMHIHSARKNINVKETVKNARVLNEIISIIEKYLNKNIDKTDYSYKRLLNHIQGALDRIRNKKYIENPLLDDIKKNFKDSFKIINEIGKKIEEEYELPVPESELGYMALHIERLKTK